MDVLILPSILATRLILLGFEAEIFKSTQMSNDMCRETPQCLQKKTVCLYMTVSVCVCVSLSLSLSPSQTTNYTREKKIEKSSFTVNYIFLYVQKVTPKLFLENPSIAFIYKYMYNTGSWAFENRIIDMNVQRHMDSNVRQCQGHW